MQPLTSYRIAFMIALAVHLFVVGIVYLLFFFTYPDKPIKKPENRFEIAFNPLSDEISNVPLKSAPQRSIPFAPKHQTSAEDSNPSSSTIQPDLAEQPVHNLNQPENPRLMEAIKRHYGEEFFKLTPNQQHYIINNLQIIRHINDIVGNRLLETKYQDELENRDNNYVEFYLHPDGSISDLALQNERSDSLLDELTLETIDLAHKQYPKPVEPTFIRIRVWIILK